MPIDPVLLAKLRSQQQGSGGPSLYDVWQYMTGGNKTYAPYSTNDYQTYPMKDFASDDERVAYIRALKDQSNPPTQDMSMQDPMGMSDPASLEKYKFTLASNSGIPGGAVDPSLLSNINFDQKTSAPPPQMAPGGLNKTPQASPPLSDLSAPSSQYSNPLSGALDIQNLLPDPQDRLAYKRAQVQNMMMGAIGDSVANRTTAGALWRGINLPQQDVSGFTGKLNEAMTKPDEERNAEMQAAQNSFALKKASMETEQMRQEMDPSSPMSKSFRDTLSGLGVKVPPTLTAAKLKEFSPLLAQTAAQKFEMQKMAMEYGLKQDLWRQGAAVPGFQLNGSVRPSEGETAELRKTAGATNDLVKKLSQYQQLIKENGPNAWTNPEMVNLAEDIRLRLKNPEAYGLTKLNETTLGIIDELIKPPSPWDIKNRFRGSQHLIEGAEALKQNLLSGLVQRGRSTGYDFQGDQDQMAGRQQRQARIAELLQKAGMPATAQR